MDWMFSFKNDLVAHAKDLHYELYKKKYEHEELKQKYKSYMEEKEKQVSALNDRIAKLELEVSNGADAKIKRQKTE